MILCWKTLSGGAVSFLKSVFCQNQSGGVIILCSTVENQVKSACLVNLYYLPPSKFSKKRDQSLQCVRAKGERGRRCDLKTSRWLIIFVYHFIFTKSRYQILWVQTLWETENIKGSGILNSRRLLSLPTILSIHNPPLVVITIEPRILIRLAFEPNFLLHRSRCLVSHGFVYQGPILRIVILSGEITPFQYGVWGYLYIVNISFVMIEFIIWVWCLMLMVTYEYRRWKTHLNKIQSLCMLGD